MSAFIDDCEKAQLPIESLLYQCFYEDAGGNIYLGVKQNAVSLLFQVNIAGGGALAGASVTINSVTQVTNALGQTTFNIAPGTYAYTVTLANYTTINGNVTVSGDQTENVGMELTIISDGNTRIWFDVTDLTTITKDGSNRVSDWADKLGSGRDLVQLNGADQPLYSTDGILFDGVSELMKTAPFVWNQPEMIYIVVKQITYTDVDFIFDGNIANSGFVSQRAPTPDIKAYAGAFSAGNSNLILNTYGIVRVLFNGASSILQVNETAAVTGNFGATNMGGFTLGAKGNMDFWGNIEVKEVIGRSIADSAGDQTIIYNYLKTKYGL